MTRFITEIISHADKATGDAIATAKEDFQRVAFAYAILSDPRRRKRYDTTGSTSESVQIEDDDFDWQSYFHEQFADVITEDSIHKFTSDYKGSDEERDAILAAYKRGKGNMDAVYEMVMTSNVLEDDERFRQIIDEAIAKEEMESFDKYTKESEKSKERRVKRAQREEAEAEEELVKRSKKAPGKGKPGKSKKGEDNNSLAALIQQRQQARGSAFFEQLEEKYANDGGSKKKKRGPVDEPPEEAFAATAQRMKKAKSRR